MSVENNKIDYLAECQNQPCRGHQNPVGRDHRARQKNNHRLHRLHGLHPQTPLETDPIDYLAERQNGPWGEELTPEEDAELRESGN